MKYQGLIICKYDRLVEVFGEPTLHIEGVIVLWSLETHILNNEPITIYCSILGEADYRRNIEWFVAGWHYKAVRFVEDKIYGRS